MHLPPVLMVMQNLPPAIWKVLGSSLGAHQNLQTLSLAGSGIGDTILQVSRLLTWSCGTPLHAVHFEGVAHVIKQIKGQVGPIEHMYMQHWH